MSIELVSLISTLIIAGITIPLLLSRIKMMSLKYHSLNLELYEKLVKLCGKDAKANLSCLLVALTGVTKSKLEARYIEWFLYTPGAYAYIKKFGKCEKYLTVDFLTNNFIWVEKYNTKWGRGIQRIKIFVFYIITGTLGLLPFLYYKLIYELFGGLPTIFVLVFSALLLVFSGMLLWTLTLIDDAKNLTKIKLVIN